MSDTPPVRDTSIYFTGTIDESLQTFRDKPRWLVEGLIPAAGAVLLHGRFSLGKSPFCWALAQSVSDGLPFFGFPISETGSVLWLELDEPLLVTNERLAQLKPRPKQMILVGAYPFSILKPSAADLELLFNLNEDLHPKLVIVNTLRKIHHCDDKDSGTPSQVYGAFRRLFPESVVVYIHHDRKQARDGEGNLITGDDEAFSGSQAWANDATVGLHMTSIGQPRNRTVEVTVTKSQVSAVGETLRLKLAEDGLTWTNTGADRIRQFFKEQPSDLPLMVRYEATANAMKVSMATVRRAIAHKP